MKKIRSFLAIALLGIVALVGCGETTDSSDSVSETSTEPVSELTLAAREAVKLILYPNISTTGVTSDFDLITEVVHLEYTFEVRYTAINDLYEKGYTETYVAISEDGLKCLITPPYSSEFDDEYVTSRIVATLFYEDVSTEATKNFNVRVNVLTVVALSDLYSANDGAGMTKGEGVVVEGYYLGEFTGNLYQGLFIGAGTSAVLLFGLDEDDLPENLSTSTIFRVTGTIDIYYGLMEIKPDKIEVLESSTIEVPVPLVLNDSTTITSADQNRLVNLTGTVTATDKGTGHSGITIAVSTGTKSFQVYVHKTNVAADQVALFTDVDVSDVITLTGFVGIYSGNYQIVAPTMVTA